LKVYFRITSEKGRGKCFLTTTTDNNDGHKLILRQQKAYTLDAHQYLFESLASVWWTPGGWTPGFLAVKCPPGQSAVSRRRFLRQNELGDFSTGCLSLNLVEKMRKIGSNFTFTF